MIRPLRNHKLMLVLSASVLLITGFRLWYASRLGIAPDEAYYRQWALAPALIYRDHPPFVAWMMRLGIRLLGETSLGLRLAAVVVSGFAFIGVYFIGREMKLDTRSALLGTLISTLLIAPASAAVICTPDTFLGAFWILAVLALLRLRATSSPAWLYVFAVASAGALWSKYTALLLLPLLLTARLSDKTQEKKPLTKHWLAAALAFSLLIAPHVIAAATSGFAAVSFQANHLAGKLPGSADDTPFIAAIRILEVLSGQFGLLSPFVAVFLTLYIFRVRTPSSAVPKAAVLLPIGATIIAGFFTHPEQNWASLGHPLAGPMVIAAMKYRYPTPQRNRRFRAWLFAVMLSVCTVFAVVHVHSLFPILPLPPKRDPTSRLHGWAALKSLGNKLDEVDAVVCDNYGLAAEFDWHLRGRRKAGIVVTSPDRNPLPNAGNWLLLSQESDFGNTSVPDVCREITPIQEILLVRRDGKTWDRVFVSLGRECRP